MASSEIPGRTRPESIPISPHFLPGAFKTLYRSHTGSVSYSAFQPLKSPPFIPILPAVACLGSANLRFYGPDGNPCQVCWYGKDTLLPGFFRRDIGIQRQFYK